MGSVIELRDPVDAWRRLEAAILAAQRQPPETVDRREVERLALRAEAALRWAS